MMDSSPGDAGRPEEPEDRESAGDRAGDKVLQANEGFYNALESLDITRMDDVWYHADWITCVHPGWPMITGWKVIRESWERIFQNTETIRFELRNVGLRIENATAWITLQENILHLSSSGVAAAQAWCTNIFLRTPDGWKLALHHASPVPEPEEHEEKKEEGR